MQLDAKPTLLVLAAGLGSRYGGLKQIDPVGPGGETIMDYSVYDALRAGFGKLVFVIRRDLEAPFKQFIGARFEGRMPVEYVFQELDRLPPGFSVPPGRAKPWGTAHAVLMSEGVIRGPFAAINADDFYGAHSFQALAAHWQSGSPDYAMVGFVLRNTLSEHGSVARGLCRAGADGYLQSIIETTGLEKHGNGVKHTDANGSIQRFSGDETVSMNLWGFTPALFGHLRERFVDFLHQHGRDPRCEFYIPTAINSLISAGQARCKILPTTDSWLGVTYREDRPRVIEGIRRLVARGDYPERLWSCT